MNRLIPRIQVVLGQKGRTANVIRQATFSVVLKGVSVLVSFASVPLLLNYLDSDKYGIWLTLVTVSNWLSLFDLGLGNGLRNKLAEAHAADDTTLARIYVSTTYVLFALTTVAFLLIFNLANEFIPWNDILNSKSLSKNELSRLTSIVFSITIIRFFIGLIGVIYIALQKSSVSDFINTLSSLLSLGCIYAVSLFMPRDNLILLAFIITTSPIIVAAIFTFFSFRTTFASIRPTFKYFRLSYSKPLLILSARFLWVQGTALIIYASANVLVINLFSPKEVIVYNVAYIVFSSAIMIIGILLSPIWSSVTNAYALKDFIFLKKMLKRLNFLSLIVCGFALILLAASDLIYDFWLKEKISVPFDLSLAMAVYAVIYIMQAPYSAYVNGMGKMRLTSSISIVGIVVYVVGAIMFSKYFSSSSGVVLGIICSSLISSVVQRIQVYKLLNKTATGIWNE